MEKTLFKEEQRYRQWYIYVILILAVFASAGPIAYGIYSQEVLHKPFGDNPGETSELIVSLVAIVVIMGITITMILLSVLQTEVRSDGFWYRFPPLIRRWRHISASEIEKYEVRIYNARREFKGHGIKFRSRRYGRGYTVSGNSGLQIYLKNGKKVLFGTQRKQALDYAMKKMMEQEI